MSDSEQQTGEDGDDPDRWASEVEDVRQVPRLEKRHGHPDRGHHRTHGQVDVARHDDKHHAGCHDCHHRGLHRQIPQVAGRQEGPVGEDVRADPDDEQGRDHSEEARVDLGRSEQGSDRCPCCWRSGRRFGVGRWRCRGIRVVDGVLLVSVTGDTLERFFAPEEMEEPHPPKRVRLSSLFSVD